MTAKKIQEKKEKAQRIIQNDLQVNFHRHWFRRYYKLTPKDPRYLEMTDTEIWNEYDTIIEYEKLQEENRKLFEPHCEDCGYTGNPVRNTNICPDCGAEMMLPDGDANQAIASDDNVIETLASEGIILSKKDRELIEKNL